MANLNEEPGLHESPGNGIVPPPLMLDLAEDDLFDEPSPPSRAWVRMTLAAIGLCWLGVFGVAAMLNPYRDGKPLLEETHRQLGLPPCNFKALVDLPCPSCGMTTSFAHLIRGDVVNSLRANFAGTLLASIGLIYLPWSVASMWRGRWLWVDRVEPWLIRLVFGWVALMLIRWAGLLAWMRYSG